MCVQDVDVQCVLQFTLLHAAGCALHRHTSRVIHRLELYKSLRRISSLAPSKQRALSVYRPYICELDVKKKRRAGRRARGSPFFEPSHSGRHHSTRANRSSPRPQPVRDRPAANGTGTPTRSNNRVRKDRETRSTVQADRDRPLSVRVSCGFDRPTQQRALRRAAQTVMILPQVHLRKPCYDFYFL